VNCLAFFTGNSPVHRVDPRARLLAALTLGISIALSARFATLAFALVCAALLTFLARFNVHPLTHRLIHANVFILFLWLVLPWSVPGRSVLTLAAVPLTDEGLRIAFTITLKANAIVLIFTALVATIEPSHLGYALKHLALPDKLVHLFVLVIRYADTIHEEYGRLRNAMKARAFRARFSRHTLRMLGYLVGLLLVRSMERSERVLAAMKCRGFDGRFHILTDFGFRRSDFAFAILALCQVGVLTWLEFA